ncbi:MAG: winged helix-turn-helix transcriptional regulator [Candidatus Levybacteria bacterium]|nr:winged helix-turn-helix transcriptional regulator [Candidatus Levybacteria bacterium]
MAMERLEHSLRKMENPRDDAIADGIRAFRQLRGEDVSMDIFLGLKGKDEFEHRMQPLYLNVANSLRAKIISGEYPIDTKIPSEKDLIKRHKVSRGTVREAVRVLIEQGFASRVQGKGTFVIKTISDGTS